MIKQVVYCDKCGTVIHGNHYFHTHTKYIGQEGKSVNSTFIIPDFHYDLCDDCAVLVDEYITQNL